jgi:hypothetical protein
MLMPTANAATTTAPMKFHIAMVFSGWLNFEAVLLFNSCAKGQGQETVVQRSAVA